MAINFFETPPEKPKIDLLGDASPVVSMDDAVTEERAVKYKLALKDELPSIPEIQTILKTPGGEDRIRAVARTKEQKDRYAAAKSVLSDGTPEEIDNAVAGVNAPVSDSVLEKQVAEAKLSTSLSLTRNPYEVNQGIEVSQPFYDFVVDSQTRREGIQKIYEDRVARNKQMSWGYWGLETAQGFINLWNESARINDILGEKLGAWLPGNNVQEQLAYIRSLPADKAIALVKQIDDELGKSDPLVAEQLLGNIATGYSQSEADIDNLFAALDVTTLPGVGLLRKGLVKAGEKAAGATVAKLGAKARIKEAQRITDSMKLKEAVNNVKAKVPAKDVVAGDLRSGFAKGPTKGAAADLEAGSAREAFASGPKAVQERLKRLGATLTQPNAKIDNILAGAGHQKEASHALALELAKKDLPEAGGVMQEAYAQLTRRTPMLTNPRPWMVETSTSHITRAGDILDTLTNQRARFTQMINSVLNVSRMPSDVEAMALDLAEKQFVLENKQRGLEGALLGALERFESTKTGLNIPYLQARWGTPSRELFTDPQVAKNFAESRYGLTNFEILQEGDGYAIAQRIHIDETSDFVRQALVRTGNKTNLEKNKILGILPVPKAISSAKDTVSGFQAAQRQTLVHAHTALEAYVNAMSEPLKALSRQERNALAKIMQLNRTTETWKDGQKTVGKFFDNISEFEQAYLQHIGRIPTAEETKAYATFVQQSDMDYIFRAVNEIKAKTRMGINEYSTVVNGKTLKLEAKELDHLPFGSRYNGSVYVSTDGSGYKRINDPGVSEALKKSTLEKKGWKVLQTFDPEDAAVREALGVSGPVNFIVVKTVKKGPLDFRKQLNYQPGFHVKYKDPYYIKQARIGYDSTGRKVYFGDTAFLGVSNDIKGAKELGLIEEARKAFLAKDNNAIDAVIKRGLPLSREEVIKLFKERFDPKVPFRLVKSGEPATSKLIDDIGSYEDFSNSPYNMAKQLRNEFTGEKNSPLWSIREGTEDNPVASIVEAPMVDPIQTQIQAMGRLIRDRHYNDYKIAASETFVREFGHLLDADLQDVRRNPVWAIMNHEVKGPYSDAERSAAKASQLAIRNLLGRRSKISLELAHLQGKLLSAAYKRSGEKYIPLLDNLTAPLLRGDVMAKVRAAAFHMKLGLFAPHQLALQGQTIFAMNAISPKHGPGATMAAVAMQMHLGLLPGDKKALEHAANSVFRAGSGWSKEQFIESYNLLKKTGFDIVKNETSWRDNISDPKLFQGKFNKVLNAGAMFFNTPERFVRIAAWNASYREYLDKFPRLAGKLGPDDTKAILTRADDLAINMTRSSHAFWQEGNWSLMTQFWGYTMRLFDLYSGLRLTRGEKARLFAMQAMLYGIPIAATPMLPIWPWEDSLRQNLQEYGVDTNHGVADLMMNGVLAASLSYLTSLYGEEIQLDLGGRWGANALPILWNLKELQQGEDGLDALVGILGGAGGSIVAQTISDGWPVVKDLMYLANGTLDGSDVLLGDLSTAGKNVASYNLAERAWTAYNTGLYKNKKGQTLAEDYGPMNAVFHALTGVETQQVNDTFLQFRSAKQQQELETKASKRAQYYIRAYFTAMDEGDYETGQEYLSRARAELVGGGFREDQIVDIFERVRKEDPLPKASQKQFIRSPNDLEEQRAREILLNGEQP